MAGDATGLFQPLTLRGVTIRNRIMVSPMCQYSAVDGVANDWHFVHLGRFALGGAGLVCVEATAVSPEGRITYGDLGLWNDEQGQALARVAGFIKGQGATPGIQLGHAGRRASTHRPWENGGPVNGISGGAIEAQDGHEAAWPTLAPSALAFNNLPAPLALDQAEMTRIRDDWAAATRRADEAGFDFVEIHGAHGYLISTFLSPSANRRTDGYGGDREGRMRFPLEVIEAVRAAWPKDKPLSIRISSIDGDPEGWLLEDTVVFAREAKARGVDVIDCSAGGAAPPGNYPRRTPDMRLFAETVRREAGVASVTLGRIADPHEAEAIIAEGRADLVAVGKGVLENPNWPQAARAALAPEAVGDDVWPVPIGYAVKVLHSQRLSQPG